MNFTLNVICNISSCATQMQNFVYIWNQELKSFRKSYYTSIFDKFDFRSHKVIANFEPGDLMTLKARAGMTAMTTWPFSLVCAGLVQTEPDYVW